MPTDRTDCNEIHAVAGLLDGPLTVEDLWSALSQPGLRSPALVHRGERLLVLMALQEAGRLDRHLFDALRSRHPRRRGDIAAAETALNRGSILPIVSVLSTMFGIKDLHGFLRQQLGQAAVVALPEKASAQAAGVALQLHRSGQLTSALFDRLLDQFPEQADAIRAAAACSLPSDEQFGYLFGPSERVTQPTHVLQIQTRQDATGRQWVGAVLLAPDGTPSGWSQWSDHAEATLPMLSALAAGTLLLLRIPTPALAQIDWEAIEVNGQPIGTRLVTCRCLGVPRPAVSLARYNLVEVTAPEAAPLFSRSHAALGRVRTGTRPAFPDLSVVRRTLEGREPVDIVHINAFDAGDGRLMLAPDGEPLAPENLTVTAQNSRYQSRQMAYLNLCDTPDTVAWVQRLMTLGFQAVIAPTDPIPPAAADAAAEAFYDAAIQRKTTLAQALQAAQRAVPEAAGRLALYADPTTRLRA